MTTYLVSNTSINNEEWGLLSGVNQNDLKKEKYNIKIQKNLSKQMNKKMKDQSLSASSKTYVISSKNEKTDSNNVI